MVKLTRLLCVLVLCLFGIASANAKVEQVHATFENPSNTNTTWNAETRTFTWSTTYYNQLRNIGLPSGDITKYKKLVVDCDIKSGDQFRILIYKGGSNKTLYASNGVNEFILADTLKTLYPDDYNEFLLNCDEICLSGNNNAAPGEAVINDVYLETYNDEGEKVYATFENPSNTNTSWDAETNTFKWTTTYYNQLRNIGLPSGDITMYKKLVVDTDIKSGDQFRILFYKGGSNKTLYASNGVNEFVLADTLKALYPDDYNEFLLACDEICLSGNNNAAPGEAVINSVYLETYPENESVEIPDIVYEEDPGKPVGDFVDFTEAFPELKPKIGLGTDGHPIVLGNGDVVVGQRSQNVIADLSAYSKLTIVTSPNMKLVLYMNHEVAAQQNAGDYAEPDAGKYVFMDVQADENGLIEVDLTQFDKQDLNCICLPWDNSNKGTVWYILLTQKAYENKTIGLVPGPWDVDGATFAAYAWNDGGNAWFPFVEASGAYATQIPENYTGIILTRINPEGTDTDPWKNVWNQTDDIDFTAIADGTVFTITGWGEGEGAKSTYTTTAVPTDLSELKAALEAALTEATGLNAYANDETLASAISAAQAALASEETTAEQFVAAATALKIAATNAAKTVLTSAVELAGIMGIDTANAQAVLDNEDATVEQLAAALKTLLTNAKSGASIYLTTAQGFFDTFDKTAAANLAPYFAAVQDALAGTDVSAMMTAAKALIEQAKTEAAGPLTKVAEYLGSMENTTIAADLAAIKTAVEEGDLKNIILAVNQLKTDLPDAINTYISAFEYASATYKDDGKTNGIEAVETAISDVEAALANEESTFLEKGAAIYKLIKAIKTFREANSTYTVAGTKDLTGTEEAWQVVADNNMTLADGLYTWTAENITVSAEAQPEFKVVITDIDNKQTWIPASEEGDDHNWVITPEYLGGEGEYNITITFNPATQQIGVTGENTKPAQIIPNGSYYVMNMAKVNEMLGSPDLEELMNSGELFNQLYMAAGHNWGTKGIVNDKGIDFTLTYNPSNKTYDFDSRVSNGGSNHFLNNSLYMDGPSYGWTIEGDVPDCTISGMFDGVKKYIAVDANQELVLTENADEPTAKWTFIHKSNYEDMVTYYGLEAMKAATVDAPADATFLIKTPDFNRNDLRNDENWTIEAGNKNLKGGGDNGYGCAESYHSTFTLSQQLADAPAGVYALTAQGFYRQDDNKTEDAPVFYANEETATFPVKTGNENDMNAAGASFAAGTYAIDPIIVQVTEAGQLTIGAKGTATSQWVIWDNFQLKYYGAEATIDQVKAAALLVKVDELLAQLDKLLLSEEIEVESVVSKLTNVYEQYTENRPTDVMTAQFAIAFLTAAVDIGEGYIKAKNVLPQMKKLTESTNFYTEEALENYYGQWYQKYEDGELAPDEANALEDPFVVTGWRANNTVDDLLMSTWDVEPMNWAQYYINTWSVEGASDGTQFEVPFFEYWTGDANSLGEKTLTGTIEGLEAGTYGVSAWVRVRGKNDFTRPAYGITMQVNEGTAIDAASTTEVSGTNFYVGQLNAIGEVGEDGKLVLKFNVAADNNISWLSFKNVKYNKMQTFTAKFENPEDTWEKVYAYTWTGGEYDKVEQLGAWPGTEITATVDESGIYTATIGAQEAPAFIIFNNGLEGDALIQTEDLTFEDGKTYKYLIPATDITISPAEGDIYAALEAAKAEVEKVGNITIELTKDAQYNVSATLTAPKSIFFYGNDATVTVAEEMTADFITLNGTEAFALKADGTESDHKLIASVEVRGVTIKGLQGAVVKDAQKTLVENLVIDYANIQMPAAGKNVLDFNGKGYAGKVTVTNSTIWANGMNTGFFAQYGSRPKNINGDWLQEFDFENNTIVNIANGKNFNNFNQKGTAQNVYTVKNNIFVNCGKQNQVVVGFNSGQTSSSPVWAVEGNYFAWGGACVNAAEAEKAGQKDGEDIVKNSVEGELTFTDATAGDFNGEFTLAEGAEAPEALGAPMWTITFTETPVEVAYYLVGNMNEWTPAEGYKLELNSQAGEGVEEYMISLDLAADAQFKVVKVEGENPWTWYPDGENNNYGQKGELTAGATKYNVYFRPNGDGGSDWFYNVLYVVDTVTDGIGSVNFTADENTVVYNLSGQKVSKAQKGLYIINGKKVVLK